MNKEQGVWIISGVPAAGKTTTAKSLAKTFDKAAVINRDDLQAQIISGSVEDSSLCDNCPKQPLH